ncbi:MAG: helix-turn-helix transcriptional regulator [Anaerolineales bacterium]|nr:helix-turn-helix transcriptional regulator [Anaerolineales bacterium]
MEKPIASQLRYARKKKVDLTPFSNRVQELLDQRNESLRSAGINSGLDHQFVRRIVNGERPNMIACIMLADYFGVNPNEFLQLAQWPTLQIFDIAHSNREKQLPPEAVDMALDLAEFPNAESRRKVVGAFRTILRELKKLA